VEISPRSTNQTCKLKEEGENHQIFAIWTQEEITLRRKAIALEIQAAEAVTEISATITLKISSQKYSWRHVLVLEL
jgi:hypothetical protein